jgi:hypothetical protein
MSVLIILSSPGLHLRLGEFSLRDRSFFGTRSAIRARSAIVAGASLADSLAFFVATRVDSGAPIGVGTTFAFQALINSHGRLFLE